MENIEEKKLIIPSTEEIINIHDYLIENTGGSKGMITPPSYVPNFCESYLSQEGIIPTLGFLISRLAKGHYFVDGNKRTAYFTGKFAALMNSYDFNGAEPDEIVREMEQIAFLDEPSSQKYVKFLIERDIIKNGLHLKDFSQFERLVLKSIAVSTKLAKR